MKRKVAILIPSLGGGGAERVVVNLVNSIDKEKFDVTIVIIKKEGIYVQLLPEDIKIIDLKKSRVRYSFFKLIKTIKKIEPDVILSTLGHLNLALLMVRFFLSKNIKIIVREANTPSSSMNSLGAFERKTNVFLYNTLYKKADLIISQCEDMKIDIINYLDIEEDKIKVIYNPLELEKISTQTRGESPYLPSKINFLAVGRLTKQKGFDILLEAFSLVKKKQPNVFLTILGEGELKETLILKAKELEIYNSVSFKGFQSNPYLYYFHSDSFVLSSRWEGFPNTLLEALACQTKVVATNCKSGPREILGDNQYGFLAKVEDPVSLAENMIKSISSENKSNDRAHYFKVEKIIQEYENVFMNI